jgi:hypothetical protein
VVRGPRATDMTGRTFGRLRVLARDANGNGNVRWLCRCRCGRRVSVQAGNLCSGNSTSCGYCTRGLRDPVAVALRLRRIRELQAKGLSLSQIGRAVGLSKQRVWQVLHGRR